MKTLAGASALITLCFALTALAQTGQPSGAAATSPADTRPMTMDSEQFQRIVAFHGHTCAGIAIGVRVAQAAARELGGDLDPYNLIAIVETNRCPVDAIQVLLHTTAGKQNLIYEGRDRNIFTFVRRPDGKGIRITVKESGWGKKDPSFESLRTRKINGRATPEEAKKFEAMMDARAAAILAAPEDQLLTIERVQIALPTKN